MRFRNRLSLLALTLTIITGAWQPPPEAQGPAPLFEDEVAALRTVQADAGAGARVLRSRSVRLFESRLRAAAVEGLAGATVPLFTLNLFGDASFPAVFERFETDVLGHQTWTGRVAGESLSTITLTWNGETVVGGVQVGDAVYRLRGTMAAAIVEQVDPATFGEELEPVRVPPGEIASAAPRAGLARPLAGETVDILVYYTPAARSAQGGQAAIEALIATAIADANTAYTRSGLAATLRLAAAVEAAGYVESSSNMNNDLVFLQSNSGIAAARTAAGADVVAMIVVSNVGGACGIGYLGPSVSFAHSVTGRDCIVGNYTFAHEVGHNFGSHHAPEDGATGAWRPYGYGYKDTTAGFRTVMAYAPGTRILNFSNPSVGYGAGNRPTGTATQNNALSLSESFPIVQGFRSLGPPPVPPGAPRNVVATASGNTVTISWQPPAIGTLTNYLAQIGTSPGGSDVFSGSVGLATSISSVVPNGTYFVRVYAQNAAGTSPASTEASVTVGPPTLAPGAPRNVIATALGNAVTVSWLPPATGTPANYLVQVGTPSGGSNVLTVAVGLATSMSGVVPNGTYFFRIYAQNAAGTSPASTEASVIVGPPAVPGTPQSLTGSVSGTTVSVSWNPPATGGVVTNYIAQVGTSSGTSNVFNGSVGLATTAFGLLGPGTYYIRLYAQNAFGISGASNELVLTVGPACAVPQAPVLSGSKSGNAISLNWTTPSGGPVTGYTVVAGATSGASGFFNGPVGPLNAASATVPNGSYFIRVIATAACGNSAASNEVALTIP